MTSILKVDQLQDSGGNALITSNGSGTITASNVGITEADMFRLTTNAQTTVTTADITLNLERVDDASFSKIGTGMTESSGIFSFPRTGLYFVESNFVVQVANTNSTRYVENTIRVTQDNSVSYDLVAETYGSVNGVSSFTYQCVTAKAFVNVTDVSNVKVKFSQKSAVSTDVVLRGNTAENATCFLFIRLGDSQ